MEGESSKKKEWASANELVTRIQELEEGCGRIISKLIMLSSSGGRGNNRHLQTSYDPPLIIQSHPPKYCAMKNKKQQQLTETQYCKIVHSMGQAIHMWDCKRRIIFCNNNHTYCGSQAAKSLFGYSAAEAYGRTPAELLTEPKDASAADYVLEQTSKGQLWAGEFPIKSKSGERFVIVVTVTPFLDEYGTLVGAMCVSTDSRPFDHIIKAADMPPSRIHIDSQQPRHVSLASKISNMALKVKAKMMKTGADDHHDFGTSSNDHTFQSEAIRTPREDIGPYPFGVFYTLDKADDHYFRRTRPAKGGCYGEEVVVDEEKHGMRSVWRGRPWKHQKEIHDDSLHCNQQAHKQIGFAYLYYNYYQLMCEKTNYSGSSSNYKQVEANSGLWPLSTLQHYSSSSSSSSSSEENSSGEIMSSILESSNASINIVQLDDHEGETSRGGVGMEYEIFWQDLIINEQIGQGSSANVYHALWYGSDVCIKLFKHQDYYDYVIIRFKQQNQFYPVQNPIRDLHNINECGILIDSVFEVASIKRLRHPNILLFIGAVTSRQHLSIVTEFLPRGCLFRILQLNSTRLDWTRRFHMAMDIARGMKYLHRCNPPILHLDLKSSNLLVDENWTVKVGDFGLSCIKDLTHLNVKADKGTPQWMAPEVLRNEDANEKSDVYSYGVILWEIITQKIPWNHLNPTQVIAAVGFMNQRLEIPKDVDPLWASLIESCWFSDPQFRPTFQEILYMLKDMQKKFVVEH